MKTTKKTQASNIMASLEAEQAFAQHEKIGYLIGGKRADALGYRIFSEEKQARLALDHGAGTILIQFFEEHAECPPCYAEDPEELAFDSIRGAGGVETWRAYYTQRRNTNTLTGKQESSRPVFACEAKRIPYDTEEQAQYEKRKRRRENHSHAIEEEKQRAEKARAQAESEQRFKEAMILLAGNMQHVSTESAGIKLAPVQNEIRLQGPVWAITYEGRLLSPVKDVDGMAYIEHLLTHPEKPVDVCDLYRLRHPDHPAAIRDNTGDGELAANYGTGGGAAPLADPETIRAAKDKIEDLTAELESGFQSEADAQKAEHEITELRKYLSGVKTSKAAKVRTFDDPNLNRIRTTVRQAIDRAKTAVCEATGGGNLGKHLDCITTGSECCYRSQTAWNE